MDVRYEIISAGLARDFSDFLLPHIAEASEDYTYYGAIAEDRLVGILAADTSVVGPEILSLSVSPEYSGRHIGTNLVDFAVADIFQGYSEGEMALNNAIYAWAVGDEQSSSVLRNIFEGNGFESRMTGSFYSLKVQDLENSELVSREINMEKMAVMLKKHRFVSLRDASPSMVNKFSNELVRKDIFPGIRRERLDEDLTFFGISDDRIYSCILFEKETENSIMNTFLYQSDEHEKKYDLALMLGIAARTAFRIKSPDTTLIFWGGNAPAKKLIDRFLPDAKESDTGTYYALPFSKIVDMRSERFESGDVRILGNETMVCKNCRHCTESILKCVIFAQKPDSVLDGGECPDFSSAS